MLIYALCQNSQGKSALYFITFISTEKWVGCKHFKSYIFEVFADKHAQVAGDSMTRSRRSSGGSRLLMKALHPHLFSHLSLFSLETNKFKSQQFTLNRSIFAWHFTTAECISMKEDFIDIFAPPFIRKSANRAAKHI